MENCEVMVKKMSSERMRKWSEWCGNCCGACESGRMRSRVLGFKKLGFGPELDERWMNKVGVPKPYRLEAAYKDKRAGIAGISHLGINQKVDGAKSRVQDLDGPTWQN